VLRVPDVLNTMSSVSRHERGRMQIQPVDITGLISSILGISIVLIPVIGLTARFALNPTVEALAKLFEKRGADETMRVIERRIELQEQEIAMLRATVDSLAQGRDFERQLASGPTAAARPHEPAAHDPAATTDD